MKPGFPFDIEEVLSGIGRVQLHVTVAYVIFSFDTVDRSFLDCALGRLGLPRWFRRVDFVYFWHLRLTFKLAAGLGEPWCLPAVRPQLYADNLKCSADCPNSLFGAARFTAQYVRSVGQDVFPRKCVLLSTSKAVKEVTKLWDISGDVGFGRSSWTLKILVVILTLLRGIGLVLFPSGLRRLHTR